MFDIIDLGEIMYKLTGTVFHFSYCNLCILQTENCVLCYLPACAGVK